MKQPTSVNVSRKNSGVLEATVFDPFAENIKYKAVVDNDMIDKMLERFVRENKIKVPIHRIDQSKYLFGSRLISAKIINGILMVRVGGGYMTMEDFVKMHQDKEILMLR
jgi:hypothetical protein